MTLGSRSVLRAYPRGWPEYFSATGCDVGGLNLDPEQQQQAREIDAAKASVHKLRELYSTIVALALAGGLEKLVSSLEQLE